MTYLETLADLHALYDTPAEASQIKVTPALTPAYHAFLTRSRFCVLTTVGPEGTDGSPRGDDGPVVRILDPQTLALPDWRGNQRLDSLRNIVRDGRISLMFLVAGSTTALRINGTARLTADAHVLHQLCPRRQTSPLRDHHHHRRSLPPMRPRPDPRRAVDQRRPVGGPSIRRRHAARGIGQL